MGDDTFNLTLSTQRAEAVAAILRTARPDLLLKVQGLGETKPVANNGTPAGTTTPRAAVVALTRATLTWT